MMAVISVIAEQLTTKSEDNQHYNDQDEDEKPQDTKHDIPPEVHIVRGLSSTSFCKVKDKIMLPAGFKRHKIEDNCINTFTALFAALLLEKQPVGVPTLKSLRLFSSAHEWTYKYWK